MNYYIVVNASLCELIWEIVEGYVVRASCPVSRTTTNEYDTFVRTANNLNKLYPFIFPGSASKLYAESTIWATENRILLVS